MNKEDFTSKVSSCRGNMVLNAPYFASLAFGLGIKQAKGTKVPTVDGKLFSLPDGYVEKLSKDELKGVLAAGALACGLGHPFRMGARDKKIWSMASCMIVRKAILESGFNLPADWPADHRFDSNTKIEDAYKILKEEQPPAMDQEVTVKAKAKAKAAAAAAAAMSRATVRVRVRAKGKVVEVA